MSASETAAKMNSVMVPVDGKTINCTHLVHCSDEANDPHARDCASIMAQLRAVWRRSHCPAVNERRRETNVRDEVKKR